MTNLTTLTLSAGIPVLGTGNVSTIDNLIAVGLPISSGLPTGSNTLGSVGTTGSLGLDYSINKPILPNTFQNFPANSTLYPSYVFLGSVAANTFRNNIDIENNSGSQIVVIRDDGTSGNNVAGNNATLFTLGGGITLGSQGGSWTSSTFKGRVQIYAASNTAQVAIMID